MHAREWDPHPLPLLLLLLRAARSNPILADLVAGRKKNHAPYQALNLLGKTLRFTADVSNVPCSNNAALYFVSMSGTSPDGYCDIQTSPSCTEIDVFEANVGAIQATIHTQRGLGGDGTCNQWGVH